MNMLDFLMEASKPKITKIKFGQRMHDPDTTEAEKERILKSVEEAGGYDNLED